MIPVLQMTSQGYRRFERRLSEILLDDQLVAWDRDVAPLGDEFCLVTPWMHYPLRVVVGSTDPLTRPGRVMAYELGAWRPWERVVETFTDDSATDSWRVGLGAIELVPPNLVDQVRRPYMLDDVGWVFKLALVIEDRLPERLFIGRPDMTLRGATLIAFNSPDGWMSLSTSDGSGVENSRIIEASGSTRLGRTRR